MMAAELTQSEQYHVVLIEQEPLTRRRIKHDLAKVGCHVEMAKGFERADILLSRSIPALILLDWDLEGSDRYLTQLRNNPKFETTFITCLGNRTQVMDRVAALEMGADEFLSKPIVEAELLAKVKAGLRIHRLQQELLQKNLTLETELEEAVSYMWAKLPLPMAGPIAIDFRFIPSQHLGGDCFDYFWLSDRKLAIYLLDVSGHGMGATLMAISILDQLRQQLEEISLEAPDDVLTYLNRQVHISENHSKYLTMWYGVYDLCDRTLTFASAGHPPAFLMNENHPEDAKLLKTPGLPIGLFDESHYQSAQVKVTEDTTLYIFSDGVYEFPDANGHIWGLKAFQSLIKQAQQQGLALDSLVQRLKTKCVARKFMDDLSLLKVSFHSPWEAS